MFTAIKQSATYRLIIKISVIMERFLDHLFKKVTTYKKNRRSQLEDAWFFGLTRAINKRFITFQDSLNQAGKASFLLAEGTLLRKFLNLIELPLLLIPFNYLFIDYAVRNVKILVSISTIWDELALMLCLLFVLLRAFWKDGDYAIKWSGIDWLVVLFIAIGIGLTTYVSPELDIAIEGFRAVYQHMLWYFFMRQLISVHNRHVIYKSIIIMGFFLGAHALYQYIAKVPMPGNWVDSTETITSRAFSIIGSPNILGAIFVLLIPLVATVAIVEKNKLFKLLSIVAMPMMILGMLFTFARQSYLALFGAMAIFFVIFYPAIVKYMIIVVGVVLAALPSVANRIFYLFSYSYYVKSVRGGRIIRYLYALDEWKKAPFLGHGLGRFGGAVATHHELTPFYVDSYYLKTLGETGLVGLSAMLALFIAVLVYAKHVIQNQLTKDNMLIVAGLMMGLLGIFFQNAVENIFEVPMMIVLFWGYVALIQSYDS